MAAQRSLPWCASMDEEGRKRPAVPDILPLSYRQARKRFACALRNRILPSIFGENL